MNVGQKAHLLRRYTVLLITAQRSEVILTVRQGGLLHGATEGSQHVHAVRLHRQIITGEGPQSPEQDVLRRAATRQQVRVPVS